MSVERAHRITHEGRPVRDAFPEVADVMIHTEPADGREMEVGTIAP